MTEYWVSQARHWCEYCKIFINGSKASIAFHENGKKHKETVEYFMRDMRKRGRERRAEEAELSKEMQKIERDALRQHLREDCHPGTKPGSAAGPSQPPPDRAKRIAELEEQIRAAREGKAAASKSGWRAVTNPDGKVYYVKPETGEMTWERPEEMGPDPASASASAAAAEWKTMTNPDGKTYYVNSESGEMSWERPVAMGAPPAAKAAGWDVGTNADGATYYYHVGRGITQWEKPGEWVEAEAAEAAGAAEAAAAAGAEAGAASWGTAEEEGGAAPGDGIIVASGDAEEDGAGNYALTVGGNDVPSAPAETATADEPEESDPSIDPNTGLGVWSVVEPAAVHTSSMDISTKAAKKPRWAASAGDDDEGGPDLVAQLKANYPMPEDVRAAAAKAAEAAAKAAEAAEAAPAAAATFKKRRGNTAGFRKKG